MSVDSLARGALHVTRFVSAALSLSLVAGCGDAAAKPDAGADASITRDAPVVTDTADAPVVTDAPAEDGGTCTDLTGAFTILGQCSPSGGRPFSIATVTQTGCRASVATEAGVVQGTVSGDTVSFTVTAQSITFACALTKRDGIITTQCDATSRNLRCALTGTPVSFPGATRYGCDVHAQDCGETARCTAISNDTMNSFLLTACVPDGAIVEGDSCVRTAGRVGAEDCARGLFCANTGNATLDTRTCQRLCRLASDCNAGETCILLSRAPQSGVCTRSCELFGTDCRMGTCRTDDGFAGTDPTSSQLTTVASCQLVGPIQLGERCVVQYHCAANLACRDGFCRRACDRTHACPAGQTCSLYTDASNPMGYGTCI